MKRITIFLLILLVLVSLFFTKFYRKQLKKANITIGILQTASHPALDHARDGFIQEMKRAHPDDIDFIIQNSEGSLSQAQTIAQSFHLNRNIKAIFTIATPALQAMARAEYSKPIFFSAVTDPKSLGLVENNNICGVSDRINVHDQITLIKEILPNALTVALLFNPAEPNSTIVVQEMKKELLVAGFKFIEVPVLNHGEIASAVGFASKKANVILVPTDNLVASAMPLVASIAMKAKIPVIASDITLVEKGALAARGVNYTELGILTAQVAHVVLFENQVPKDLSVVHPKSGNTVISQSAIVALGLTISNELLRKFTVIR